VEEGNKEYSADALRRAVKVVCVHSREVRPVSRSAANSFAVLSSLDSAGPESAADVKTPEVAAVFGRAFLREAVVGAFRLLPHKGHGSSLFFFLIFLLLLSSVYSPAGWIGSKPMTRRCAEP
jgi:hypothetical protein